MNESFVIILFIQGTHLRDKGINSLCRILKTNTTLTELNLSGYNELTLRMLSIYKCHECLGEGTYVRRWITILSKSLETNTSLTKLNLESKTHVNIRMKVKLIILEDNSVGSEAIMTLCKSLLTNSTLTSLNLANGSD